MSTQRTWLLTLTTLLLLVGGVLGSLQRVQPRALAVDSELSVIVSATDGRTPLRQSVESLGGEVVREFATIQAVEARVSRSEAAALERAGLALFPNRTVGVAGSPNSEVVPSEFFPEALGLQSAWAQGLTGAGVTVAVVDSGLGDQYGAKIDPYGNRVLAEVDFAAGANKDKNGHGSHIASIIGSSLCRGATVGTTACPNGTLGAAPGVNLVSVRVLGDDGSGSYADVIAGIEWVIANKDLYNIRVMNLSLTATPLSPYWADPLNKAVMAAWESGIFVAAAAGNGGGQPGSITVPGNIPYVMTVGLLTDNYTPADWADDYVAPVSGMGPTWDGFLKPDVVAPGGHIASFLPRQTTLADARPETQQGSFNALSGTSQATAVASGVAALLLENDPSLTNGELKALLRGTTFWATQNAAPQSVIMQGAGRLHVPSALASTLRSDANAGMDIHADLTTNQHYTGFFRYDAEHGVYLVMLDEDGEEMIVLEGGPSIWSGGPSIWSGGTSIWSGGTSIWSGGPSIWSGGPSIWSGGPSIWSGGPSIWSGGTSIWSGGPSIWSGGPSIWSGGPSVWSGGPSIWSGSWTGDSSTGVATGLSNSQH